MSTGTTQQTNGNGGSKVTTVSPGELGNKLPAAPVNELRKYMDQMKSQIAVALPRHMNADRVTRLIMTEFSRSADLQKCSMHSIIGAVMTASQLGLEIGVGGQAYIIPYKTTATFVPGWKGLIDLNSRAGRSSAWTGAVFQGDEFDWALGDSPFVKHKPKGESNPDKMLFAYAIGRINGSEWPIIECWPNARILSHRDKYNKVGRSHYSFSNWEMYARKVVLLQVLKYLPKSIELQAAIELADAEEQGRGLVLDADFVTIEPSESKDSDTSEGTK